MGKHNNYTNYHKMRNNEPAKEEVVEEVVDAEPVAEEVTEKAVEDTKAAPVIGVVNCTRLNVRVAPNTTATVACVVTKLSELEINEASSTEDWYNVITASGVSGYCMKAFVTVK